MVDIIDFEKFAKDFKELNVYKKSYDISLEIHATSLVFPKTEQFGLADQIRRASKSICANLAEGFAKQTHSKLEFKRFVSMAIGSSNEMHVWIDYCLDLKYIDGKTYDKWNQEYTIITKMLIALRNKIKD